MPYFLAPLALGFSWRIHRNLEDTDPLLLVGVSGATSLVLAKHAQVTCESAASGVRDRRLGALVRFL